MIDKTGVSLNGWRRTSLLLMTLAIWLSCVGVSYGAIIINAPMTDTNSSGWTLGGTPTSVLTGDGTTDPVGQGWLRLTNNTGNQTGYAYNNKSFDLSGGVLVQFDYVTWGGTGADGYSVYLFDAGVSPFNIGAFGGSLGYAQKTGIAGISGGYVGIGVDEYGNFSNPTEGRYLGPGAYPNTVTVRGSVVGFGVPAGNIGQTTSTTSYPWIATSSNLGSLWYNGATRPVQTSANYRKVVIRISSAPNPVADVWIQFGYNQPLTQMITSQALPAISASQLLKIGYAASTGGSTNYHEIRNLLVTDLNTSTSIDLGITKTASVTTATIGSPITYTVTARNNGPNNVTATGVGIVDNVPASITGVTWTCAVVAGSPALTGCGAASGSGNAINTTANLPYGGAVIYTISGTVSAPTPAQLSTTASLTIPGSVIDYNPNDDSATVSISVTSNLSTSTKTWVDLNGGDQVPGDVIRYTITLNESTGAAASGVTVTDNIPANVNSFAVVSIPAGATDSSTSTGGTNGTGYLNVTGINVPASGTATVVIDVTIANGTAAGTLIDNTATVTNPNGLGAAPAAPTITVSGGSISGTGNKPLYLYDAASTPTRKLSRTPMTVSSTSYVEIPEVTTYTWTLSPVLQSVVTIISGNIPVQLMLSSTSTRTYTIPVTLRCGATTVATLTTGSIALTSGAAPVAFNINLPLATNYTCAAGNALYLDVRNNQSGTGTRNIRVYPAPTTGNYSYVNPMSQNVINVDSIGFYDAAYPGGSALTSIRPGDTVRIRAVVSDPFGDYDITGATLTLTNSAGAAQLNAAMSAQSESVPADLYRKTFEYSYTIPSGGMVGNWTARVEATEGTETTPVTDYGVNTISVALPSITFLKTANNPTIVPGGTITYTITAHNTGGGNATNVILTDPVPPYTTYVANSIRLNGITVVGDGATSPLIAGLLVDNNNSRASGVAASGILPAGGVATVTFQVMVNP